MSYQLIFFNAVLQILAVIFVYETIQLSNYATPFLFANKLNEVQHIDIYFILHVCDILTCTATSS